MSNSVVEVTVVLKDCERTLRQKFISYDPIELTPEDRRIQAFVQEALDNFRGEPDDISIKCSMEIK